MNNHIHKNFIAEVVKMLTKWCIARLCRKSQWNAFAKGVDHKAITFHFWFPAHLPVKELKLFSRHPVKNCTIIILTS